MKTIEVVAAVIYNNGTYLATQKGDGPFRGQWEFPGGKIEIGETKQEALIREIKEELSLTIEVEKWICTTEYDYPTFHITMHSYLCKMIEGKPILNEHQALKWLPAKDLNNLKWLPADIKTVQMLQE
ncbi:MAG: (deoxy)nucleoside triphosphate pyrophosphohydrolase [Porphyromonadaceae bacterium]|nr:(deoxy)nucleoside triphosphate pyrophosphohydrolase [Porphyromonadaceae bacterium]